MDRGSIGKLVSVDHGYDKLIATMRTMAAGQSLTVGIHEEEGNQPAEGGEGEDSDATLLEVATWNEFGGPATESKPNGNPPRRSFLADWADESEEENREAMRRVARAVLEGKIADMPTALNRLGLLFVGKIQERIKAGIEPENADSTIERKGSSTPLISSGQLWQNITHQVGTGTE